MTLTTRDKVALVIDDEVFARLFAIQILLDEGFMVIEAENAEEGLAMLDQNDDVNVVFTDIAMPGNIDGFGLSRWVERHRPEITLVLTSGNVTPVKELLPEAARFLPKPYTAHALMTAIRE